MKRLILPMLAVVACRCSAGVEISMPIPSDVLYTRSMVTFQVMVKGDVTRIELLLDGVTLTEIDSSRRYVWNSERSPEGPHEFQAVAYSKDSIAKSEVRTVVVDRTPPSVATVTPKENGESIGGVAEVTFSEPILRTSLTDGSVVLEDGAGVIRKSIVLAPDNTSLVVAPEANLALPSKLRLTLSSSVTDLAGNALSAAHSVAYTGADLHLTLSSAPSVSRSTVSLQVGTSREYGGEILLRLNGNPWRTIQPPYQSTWDVSSEAEGDYALTALVQTGAFEFSSDVTTVKVDRTAPVLQWRAPREGAGLLLRDGIRLQFSELVESATGQLVDAVSLQDANGQAVAVKQVSPTSDGKGLAIELVDGAITFPEQVKIQLNHNLTDLAGNPVQRVDIPAIEMRAWDRIGDRLLDDVRSGVPSSIQLAADERGSPVVAWIERVGADSNIFVRRWDGLNWEPMGGPGTFPSGARLVRLGSGSRGIPTLAYLAGDPNEIQWKLEVQQWSSKLSAWEKLVESGATAVFGKLRVTSAGQFLLLVVGWDKLNLIRSSASNNWTNDLPEIPQNGEYDLAVDNNDVPIVLWAEQIEGVRRERAFRPEGNGWVPVTGHLSESCSKVNLEVNPLTNEPTIACLFHQWGGGDFVSVQSWSGGAWRSIGKLEELPFFGLASLGPSLAIGRDGRPMVAWGTSGSVSAAKWNGTKWSVVDQWGEIRGAYEPVAISADERSHAVVGWSLPPAVNDPARSRVGNHIFYSNSP